jgi:hypothetical protein
MNYYCLGRKVQGRVIHGSLEYPNIFHHVNSLRNVPVPTYRYQSRHINIIIQMLKE